MSRKSVPQECPTRVSYKSAPQECPTRVSQKSDPQECLTRVFRKSVPCPTRQSYKSYKSVRVSRKSAHKSCKSVPQECSTRVSYKSVPQECPRRVSVIQGAPQGCTRVSRKGFLKECVLQECPTCQKLFECFFPSTCLHSVSWVPSCFFVGWVFGAPVWGFFWTRVGACLAAGLYMWLLFGSSLGRSLGET